MQDNEKGRVLARMHARQLPMLECEQAQGATLHTEVFSLPLPFDVPPPWPPINTDEIDRIAGDFDSRQTISAKSTKMSIANLAMNS
jgi:hypothetical protein